MTAHLDEEATEPRTDLPPEDVRPPGTPTWQWIVLAGLVAVLAVVLSLGFLLLRDREDARVVSFAESGGPPALAGQTLEGDSLALADYRGDAVVVAFWAHWCPHCRAEMPLLQDLFAAEEIELLTVTTAMSPGTGPTGYRTPEEFRNTIGLSAPVIVDRRGAMSLDWHVEEFPTLYFVDADGRVREIMVGEVPAHTVIDAFDDLSQPS